MAGDQKLPWSDSPACSRKEQSPCRRSWTRAAAIASRRFARIATTVAIVRWRLTASLLLGIFFDLLRVNNCSKAVILRSPFGGRSSISSRISVITNSTSAFVYFSVSVDLLHSKRSTRFEHETSKAKSVLNSISVLFTWARCTGSSKISFCISFLTSTRARSRSCLGKSRMSAGLTS